MLHLIAAEAAAEHGFWLVRHVREWTPEVVGGLVGYFMHNLWHGLYHKLHHGLHWAIARGVPRLTRGGH